MLHQRMRIPHFIVVPRDHFYQVAAHDARKSKIGDRSVRIADDIGRNERLFSNGKYFSPSLFACRFFNIAFTSSALVSRLLTNVMSAMEPTTIGTRIAMPSNFPSRSLITFVVAMAAPVVPGMIF